MTRWLGALIALAAVAAGCGGAQVTRLRGEQTKREIYLNLMTEEQAARFHEMEVEWKDDEQMLLYCQEVGAYQKWRAATPEYQKLIRRRQLEVGMSATEVQMAWGRPAATEETTTAAERLAGHGRRLWSFDPVTDAEGTTYERQVCFFDDAVQWYKDFRDRSLWQRMKWWEK